MNHLHLSALQYSDILQIQVRNRKQRNMEKKSGVILSRTENPTSKYFKTKKIKIRKNSMFLLFKV